MTDANYVLITRPRKNNDPTIYTFNWGGEIAKIAYQLGYTVIDMKVDDCDYETVSKYLYHYRPRLYIHVGHGCVANLQGQQECIITDGTGHTTENQNCTLCENYSNLNLLNDTIVYTIACYSSAKLGRWAVQNGCSCYTGYSELLLFPVDDMNSQDLFRDVHLEFIRNLLSGDTVYQAEMKMSQMENVIIKEYKTIDHISLPMLWNQLHREVIGNPGATIWR